MFESLKNNIIFLGLSFKKELLIFIGINLLMIGLIVGLVFLKVQTMIIIITGVFVPFVDYLYLSRYGDSVKRLKDQRNSEFISLLAYFEIYIANKNNVYKSFESLLPYCSEWMQEKVDTMLKEIDNDKSVAPFINFSNNFTYLAIQNVMISIYQMVEQGESEYSLVQFDYLFNALSDSLYREKIERRQKSFDVINAFPLFGAGFITIILTLSIMMIIGDVVNVI